MCAHLFPFLVKPLCLGHVWWVLDVMSKVRNSECCVVSIAAVVLTYCEVRNLILAVLVKQDIVLVHDHIYRFLNRDLVARWYSWEKSTVEADARVRRGRGWDGQEVRWLAEL